MGFILFGVLLAGAAYYIFGKKVTDPIDKIREDFEKKDKK